MTKLQSMIDNELKKEIIV